MKHIIFTALECTYSDEQPIYNVNPTKVSTVILSEERIEKIETVPYNKVSDTKYRVSMFGIFTDVKDKNTLVKITLKQNNERPDVYFTSKDIRTLFKML